PTIPVTPPPPEFLPSRNRPFAPFERPKRPLRRDGETSSGAEVGPAFRPESRDRPRKGEDRGHDGPESVSCAPRNMALLTTTESGGQRRRTRDRVFEDPHTAWVQILRVEIGRAHV